MVNNGVTFNQKGRKNFLHESDQSIHLMTTLINVDDDLKNGSFSETTILIPSELSDYPVSTSTVCRQNGSMRFFVISLMAIPILIQVFSQSIWGAIHESALLAFPNWTRRSISLLPIWGSVITAILIIPACVAINKCGLRLSLLCSCCFYTLGSAIRCMPSMYSCTLCLHLSAIFLSVGGVLMTPLIITMSALWFPKNERNMATGVCLAVRMLGSAATYVIGPYVVSVARDGLEKPFIMKIRIMQMLYTCKIITT
ncbi:solute carrier family 49 member 4-like [Rhopalosiphum maidis]|uniref:solute carrier family 49 member 4-like n=1 Tax=Rhopalosiphum maidis TaxID=43146 RepID=UPI000EFFC475|nr:solute carrier family 49 member 4-like [Rhopalosiphum maidis]